MQQIASWGQMGQEWLQTHSTQSLVSDRPPRGDRQRQGRKCQFNLSLWSVNASSFLAETLFASKQFRGRLWCNSCIQPAHVSRELTITKTNNNGEGCYNKPGRCSTSITIPWPCHGDVYQDARRRLAPEGRLRNLQGWGHRSLAEELWHLRPRQCRSQHTM